MHCRVPESRRNRLELAALQVQILQRLLETVERSLGQGEIVVRHLERLQPQGDERVVGHKPDLVVGKIQATQDSEARGDTVTL